MFERCIEFMSWAALYDEGLKNGRRPSRHKAWLMKQWVSILHIDGELNPEESLTRVLNFI